MIASAKSITNRKEYLRLTLSRELQMFDEAEQKHRQEMMKLATSISWRRERLAREMEEERWVHFLAYCKTGKFPE